MSIAVLQERARIVSAIRRFFDEQDFVEVETAVRIPAPAPEEHIDCPPVEGGGYLRASPEIQMKKLLAAGMDRIYQIGPCFREGEKGLRHNPEFTMIEWYRRGATHLDIRDDLVKLLERLFAEEGQGSKVKGLGEGRDLRSRSTMEFVNSSVQPSTSDLQPFNISTLRVREAYLKHAGWDPWRGEWDQDRFDFDMATKIEPAIREMGGGIFLTDYPPQAASLSKLSTSDLNLPIAERWEFYYDGMELANCFAELCDGDEQRKRFQAAKEARKSLKESDYPIDEAFLSVLPQIGSAAGVALGIDRLVMVLTGTKDISAVRAEI